MASTRTPERVPGAVHGDFDDPASLERAWTGSRTLVLVPSDAPGARRTAQHGAALAAAGRAGVTHVVYPGLIPHGAAPTLADDHLATEDLLRGSGLAWTVLRNGIYADNVVAMALTQGSLAFGGGTGRVAWVTRADLAEAAAVIALAPGEHAGETLTLTGLQALSLEDVGKAIAWGAGRAISVTALDADAFAAGLSASGMPLSVVEAMRGTARAIEDGRLSAVDPTLAQLLGRPRRSVEQLAAG